MALSDRVRADGSLYRAVWRWHFFAGLIVLPVLLWLAITGGLYLYKPEIEGLVYPSRVTPLAGPLPLDRLVAQVEREAGGRIVQIARPARRDASWRMTLADSAGARRLAFVDPYRGRALATTTAGGIMQTVRGLHSLAITGPVGNILIEIVAGWAILLVLTGLYLWWPRHGSLAIGVRGRRAGRLFWRDLHASVGVVAAAAILFLALTGMPWTRFAGGALQGFVASRGLGRPAPPAQAGGGGHDHGRETLPWSMQAAAHPQAQGSADIGPAGVAAIAASRGLSPPWTMTLPATPRAPYLVSAAIVHAGDAHILYVDGESGRVLQEARPVDFGPGARAIEWGIATHQGQQYGEPNRLVMLAGCLSIIVLAITAPILWWKRRQNGRLSPPPRAIDRRTAGGVAAIMVAIGALFPLTGASMLVALAGDALLARRMR